MPDEARYTLRELVQLVAFLAAVAGVEGLVFTRAEADVDDAVVQILEGIENIEQDLATDDPLVDSLFQELAELEATVDSIRDTQR